MDLLDGESAYLPTVKGGGEGAPMGLVELEATEGFAGGLVGGQGVGEQRGEDFGLFGIGRGEGLGDGFTASKTFQGEKIGQEVLSDTVALEAGFSGCIFIISNGAAKATVGLTDEDIDDMAIADGFGVLTRQFCVDMGGVGHTGRRGASVVADKLAVAVDHADTEEGEMLFRAVFFVADGLVVFGPRFKIVVETEHIL